MLHKGFQPTSIFWECFTTRPVWIRHRHSTHGFGINCGAYVR
ncbi:hypothetical protein OH687_35130 [Burkholderia anthina]|nr:hypothetical protein OH687_35130 [Burkholderia anthina]